MDDLNIRDNDDDEGVEFDIDVACNHCKNLYIRLLATKIVEDVRRDRDAKQEC